MSDSRKLEWIKTGTLIVGTVVAVGRAFIEYRKFRQEQDLLEYRRDLQRKAWHQVMRGELSEAKIGDVSIKAPNGKGRPSPGRDDVAIEVPDLADGDLAPPDPDVDGSPQ